jgi:hypothetical protein
MFLLISNYNAAFRDFYRNIRDKLNMKLKIFCVNILYKIKIRYVTLDTVF